jgi:deoxyadenosine/deoxycytidine kinase
MKRFIAVAGNIGVGKSTLVRLISRRLGWEPFYEAVGENPYLADFYQDMRAWSFHSQIFFLSRRLRHHRELLDHPGSVVQDRTVYEDAEIFAENLYRQGLLPPPDLVIYLRAAERTLTQRIEARARDYERQIAPAYLAQLNDLYETWIAGFSLCPVLTVPADALDYVAHDAHLDLVIEKIMDKLQGKEEVIFDEPEAGHG